MNARAFEPPTPFHTTKIAPSHPQSVGYHMSLTLTTTTLLEPRIITQTSTQPSIRDRKKQSLHCQVVKHIPRDPIHHEAPLGAPGMSLSTSHITHQHLLFEPVLQAQTNPLSRCYTAHKVTPRRRITAYYPPQHLLGWCWALPCILWPSYDTKKSLYLEKNNFWLISPYSKPTYPPTHPSHANNRALTAIEHLSTAHTHRTPLLTYFWHPHRARVTETHTYTCTHTYTHTHTRRTNIHDQTYI